MMLGSRASAYQGTLNEMMSTLRREWDQFYSQPQRALRLEHISARYRFTMSLRTHGRWDAI
jgi:hypothetical protein